MHNPGRFSKGLTSVSIPPDRPPFKFRRSRPTARSPIPPAVRTIIERVHRRYAAACRRGKRPAIDGPHAGIALLTVSECFELAAAGYYPLPPEVIRLGATPAEHQRQEIIDAVAAQLPDAVAAVLETAQ